MRDIKFRAWAPDQKNWVNLSQAFDQGRLVHKFEDDTPQNLDLQDSKFLVWSQYTGLKDKNGQEIYEGDILDYVRDYGPRDTRVVQWVSRKTYTGFNIGQSARFEVIGNIYENKDLLK
jgi:uncharacterized phage protein (TIGR01671 family)